jgi:hypothetical protein
LIEIIVKNVRRRSWIVIFAMLFNQNLFSQGINTKFEQNRVNYKNHKWSVLSGDDISVYYYKGGEELSSFARKQVLLQMANLQKALSYRVASNVDVVLYNNITDYLHSNIGIVNPEFNSAGLTKMVKNRMVLYYPGSKYEFALQIRKELAKVLINEMLYGGTINERVQNSVLLILPDWYQEGLSEYLGYGWDTEMDNWARENFLNKKLDGFTEKSYQDRIRIGRSIWNFIVEKYGENVLANMLYATRVSRNYESSILYATGLEMKDFLKKWREYYKLRYMDEIFNTTTPRIDRSISAKLKKKPHTQFRLSPNGGQIAIVINNNGKFNIWIHDVFRRQAKKVYSGGYKVVNKKVNYSLPVISWKDNYTLGILLNKKGKYTLEEFKISNNHLKSIKLKDFDQISEFTYNGSGDKVLINGLKNGRTNLYILDLADKNIEQITNTNADKFSPRFINDDKEVIFVSETFDPLNAKPMLPSSEVVVLNLKSSTTRVVVPSKEHTRYRQPMELGDSYYTYLSDESGIINSYACDRVKEDRKYFTLSNYPRNIQYQDIVLSRQSAADLMLFNGEFNISSYEWSSTPAEDSKDVKIDKTFYRKMLESYEELPKIIVEDSTEILDSVSVDSQAIEEEIKTYDYSLQRDYPIVDYSDPSVVDNPELLDEAIGKSHTYRSRFQMDFFVSQFDNSVQGTYYYPSSISPTLLDPGVFNGLVKVRVNDLMNDAYVEGGMRFLWTFQGAYYFLKAGWLKGRIDKEVNVYRRSILLDYVEYFRRNITSGGDITFSYPINEKLRVELAGQGRVDRISTLSSGRATLSDESLENVYAGGKSRIVFDNTVSRGLNQLSGQRWMIFAENMKGVGNSQHIVNLGFDARNYTQIYRGITLANRLTMNSSIGKSKVLYRLGGMENWIDRDISTSNLSIEDVEDYSFQMFAGNLRGFDGNEQKGNSYFILNTELRIPVVSTFYNGPVRSSFMNNLMLVQFVDVGSAWVGKSPWSEENPNRTKLFIGDFYRITATADRNPIFTGIGGGLRSKILGYYVKYDFGWGTREGKQGSVRQYFTLGMDF